MLQPGVAPNPLGPLRLPDFPGLEHRGEQQGLHDGGDDHDEDADETFHFVTPFTLITSDEGAKLVANRGQSPGPL